ncbi:MAG: preprotein translocase subunit SecE [Candidimonas sp.]|nr:MAG: preprotein translocase subunit SecE [Candidimonas sp.]
MPNTKVETVNSTADRIKLVIAVLAIIAGVVGYSMLDGQPTLVRVGTFVAGVIVAAIIVWFSETGRRTVGFSKDSYNEVKRVVWPVRKETTRMTGIVFAFVAAMALLLWVVDKLLEWIIYGVLLGWK